LSSVAIAPVLRAQGESDELSDAEKLYGLSLIWQEVNYNFAFFDQVPHLNWDSVYQTFIPQVLSTSSAYEYYRTLVRFVALLEDGHTYVSIPSRLRRNESSPWVLTRRVEDRLLVSNVGRELEPRVPVHSVIETVNGTPAAEYALATRLPYTHASTDYQRRDLAFGQALWGGADEDVRLGLVTPDGERRELTLPRDLRTHQDEWVLPTSRSRPGFEWRWVDHNIAYVAINTFGNSAVVDSFEAALPELYGAAALVIDLRNNTGGNSGTGYAIAAYLTNDTLPTSAWRTREHVAVYKEWGKTQERRAAYHRMDAWRDGGTHGPVVPAEGRRLIVSTVVLQGHYTFSAAEDFLVAIDGIPHVTTLGGPSGGSTGQPLSVPLPGGGRVRICAKRDAYPDGREFVGIGVIPDVQVEPTVAEIQAGRDPELERAVALLTEQLGGR
jgi:C-terminal processing protease CtpA/Prc